MNALMKTPKMDLSIGLVTEVGDPNGRFRVKVKLLSHYGPDGQEYEMWARVTVPIAGAGYGTVFMPDVDDEVLVGFIEGDPTHPIVLGSMFNGVATPPHNPEDSGSVKRWSITGHKGTTVDIDESRSSKVTIKTKNGVKVEVNDSGSKVVCTNGSETVELRPGEVNVTSSGTAKVEAAMVEVTAGMVTVDAAISQFSGIVTCDVLQTNTVISTTYTPGAGNIW